MNSGEIRSYTAICTPYEKDGSIAFETLGNITAWQAEQGNHILCCGTTGDVSALSLDEKIAVTGTCAAAANHGIQVLANAGCPSTRETIETVRRVLDAGADAAVVILPYFVSCGSEEIYRHYMQIADAVGEPVYIYNIPSRTLNAVDPECTLKLAANGAVRGIKESSGNREHLKVYCRARRERPQFEVYVGTDSLIQFALELGSSGCVSGLANIIPAMISSLCRKFKEGNLEGARLVQQQISEIRTALYALGDGPAVIKCALDLLMPEVGTNRAPAPLPDAAMRASIKSILVQYRLLN